MIPLAQLEARFLKRDNDTHFHRVETINEADGIIFKCPKCYKANNGVVGTHSVICWRPRVPQTTSPTPGRWEFRGTGLSDLTLVARSSSILLTDPGCQWHGWVIDGHAVGGF